VTVLALGLAALAAAADPSEAGRGAPVPRPGLLLPSVSVLARDTQVLSLESAFRGNYPILGVGFAEGMPGGLELAGAGGFDHARVDWPGAGGRHDADVFQAALRLGLPLRSRGRFTGGAAFAAGFTRGYDRTRFDDGRYSFAVNRTVWGEFAAGAGVVMGARATVAERYLRDVGTRTNTHAIVFGAESPAWRGASFLGEIGFLIKNPLKWKKPWAAGIRLPAGGQAIDAFVSNARGVTFPGSLAGTQDLFYALRILLSM